MLEPGANGKCMAVIGFTPPNLGIFEGFFLLCTDKAILEVSDLGLVEIKLIACISQALNYTCKFFLLKLSNIFH